MPSATRAWVVSCAILPSLSLSASQPPLRVCPDEIRVEIPNDNRWQPSYWFDLGGLGRYDLGRLDRYDNSTSHLTSMEDVYWVLKSCPNITVLDVTVTQKGCTKWPDRFNLPFDAAGESRLPSLESLSLEGYDFEEVEWDWVQPPQQFTEPTIEDTEESWLYPWDNWFSTGKASKWFSWRDLPVEQRRKTNFELWLDAMDFSQLRFLSLKPGYSGPPYTPYSDAVMKRLPKMVPSLKELVISGGWWSGGESNTDKDGSCDEAKRTSPASEFILGIPPGSLERLSWTDTNTCDEDDFIAILKHHGPSLTSLEWRSAENEYCPRPVFSIPQMRRLGTLAPNLEFVSIDMNREGTGTWPLKELATVVESLPNLRELTVYFEMGSKCQRGSPGDLHSCIPGCIGMDMFAHPLLNSTQATVLFHHLRKYKLGSELTSAVFRSGSYERQSGELMEPKWLEGRESWSECSILRQDGTRKEQGEALCSGRDTVMSGIDKNIHDQCKDNLYGVSPNPRWLG